MIVLQSYCETFKTEPSVALRKSYSTILAACQLKLLSQRETRSNQEQYVEERPQYSQQGFDHNARGDPRKMQETSVIPLRGLAENPAAITGLQNVINNFR